MNVPHSTRGGPSDLLHGLEYWATPALVLVPAEDECDGGEDFVVVAANLSACDEFGDEVIGARLDRDRPFGPMASLVGAVSAAIREDEVRVADRTITGHAAGSRHLRYTILPSADAVTVFVEDRTTDVGLRQLLAATGKTLAGVRRRRDAAHSEA